MNITTKTIWIATYRTLERASISVGDKISLKELMRLWADTRLRQNDLARALDTLVRTGAIRLEMDTTGPQVLLADNSFINKLPEEELATEVKSLEQLAWVRQRQDGNGESEKRRRFSDSDLQYVWERVSSGA